MCAWLLLNQIKLESKQMMQLYVQNVDGVTRRGVLSQMLADDSIERARPEDAERIQEVLKLSEAFLEHVDVALPTVVPEPQSFTEKLEELVATGATYYTPDQAGEACLKTMVC